MRQIWRDYDSVLRLWIIVRAVIRVAPVIYSFWKRFDQNLGSEQSLSLWAQDPKCLGLGNLCACRTPSYQGVGQIVGQM